MVFAQDNQCVQNDGNNTVSFTTITSCTEDFTGTSPYTYSGTSYDFTLSANKANLDINADVTITATTVNVVTHNQSILTINAGQTLTINGDLDISSTNGSNKSLVVNGTLIVTGNIDFSNVVVDISGTGDITTESITGAENTTCSDCSSDPGTTINVSGSCEDGTGDFCTTALPVELLSFNVSKSNKEVSIYWATASETNNDYFEIERSMDGLDFDVIAKITGAGNSYFKQEYQYTDLALESSTVYYRLKQVDYDGATTIYRVKQAVETGYLNVGNQFIIAPNPTNSDQVTVYWDEINDDTQLRFVIINTAGYQVYDQWKDVSPMRNLSLDLSGNQAGIYYMMIYGEGGLLGKERLIIN